MSHNKILRTMFLICLLVLLTLIQSSLVNAKSGAFENYEILLKSRHFVPEPDCVGSGCEIISYSSGVLEFNTTSFSSFKANGS